MSSVTFHVPGKPQGKARARTVYNQNLKHSVSYTPENDLLYENLIKTMYIHEAKGVRFGKEIPVTVRIVARFLPPKSVSKIKQKKMLSGEILPLKKPDIDNIVKVVADALNGVAYQDDVQIAKIVAEKQYAEENELEITIEKYAE